MPSKLVCALWIFGAVCARCLDAQVVVMDAGEGWYSSNAKLSRGQRIPTGTSIKGVRKNSLLVLDCQRLGLLTFFCNTDTCQFEVCETKAEGVTVHPRDDESGLATMFSSLKKRLYTMLEEREPTGLITAAARAPGSPTDAVLLLDGRGVHWGPALRRILEGKYCFTIAHLGGQPAGKAFTLDWDASVDPEGIAAVPGLAPGGYRIEKGAQGTCAPDPEASPAWVVIAPESSFNALAARWSQTTTWLDQLPQGSSLSAVTTARHAVLASFAELVEQR